MLSIFMQKNVERLHQAMGVTMIRKNSQNHGYRNIILTNALLPVSIVDEHIPTGGFKFKAFDVFLPAMIIFFHK